MAAAPIAALTVHRATARAIAVRVTMVRVGAAAMIAAHAAMTIARDDPQGPQAMIFEADRSRATVVHAGATAMTARGALLARHRDRPKTVRAGGPPLFPPGLREELRLTDDQNKQLDDLRSEIHAKIEKILTSDQRALLAQAHRRGPGGPPDRPDRRRRPRRAIPTKRDDDDGYYFGREP